MGGLPGAALLQKSSLGLGRTSRPQITAHVSRQPAVAGWCASPIFWASEGGKNVPQDPCPSQPPAWQVPCSSSNFTQHQGEQGARRWAPVPWRTDCLGHMGLGPGQRLEPRHVGSLWGTEGPLGQPLCFLPHERIL